MSDTKKWTSTAGPIQTKKVNEAIQAITREGQTHTEKSGVIGASESEMSFWSPFGGTRQEASKALTDLGECFGWTVTRENYQRIIAAAGGALVKLKQSRPVKDERVTQEQDTQRKAEWKARDDAQAEEQRKKREAVAAKVIELQPLYSWAVGPRDGLSEHARVGQNIRLLLDRTFPGVAFRVRTDYNSARVEWELGPRTKEVDAALEIFKDGAFNGQDDSYDYDHSVRGEALQTLVGRLRYPSTSRNFPDALYEQVGRLLCELQHIEYQGTDTTLAREDEPHTTRLGEHVYQLLHATSFPAGAQVVGIYETGAERQEFNALMFAQYGTGWATQENRLKLSPEEQARLAAFEAQEEKEVGEHRHWCALKLEVPAVAPAPPAAATPTARSDSGIVVRRNHAKNGVEIKFPGKPGPDVLSRIKAARWRWFGPTQCWYTRFSPAAWAFAHEIAGLPAPALPQEQAPDATDLAYEDRCAEACGLAGAAA